MGNAKTLHDVVREELRYRESHLNSAKAADAIVYWFMVASLAAFFVAGILVYRDATLDGRFASSGTRQISIADSSSPVEQPPIYAHVEGVDP
jgi:hypothetical protein